MTIIEIKARWCDVRRELDRLEILIEQDRVARQLLATREQATSQPKETPCEPEK